MTAAADAYAIVSSLDVLSATREQILTVFAGRRWRHVRPLRDEVMRHAVANYATGREDCIRNYFRALEGFGSAANVTSVVYELADEGRLTVKRNPSDRRRNIVLPSEQLLADLTGNRDLIFRQLRKLAEIGAGVRMEAAE